MFLFFCWTLWIFLVIWVLMDIFRSHDLSGWSKAGWTVMVILVPLIGVLAYEIAHGDHLFGARDRALATGRGRGQDEVHRPDGTNGATELSKLSDLHDRGVISDAEFARGKEKILQ
jgi:hypothetical protein